MGYTTEEGMVRVDFFKEHGIWYCTEAVKWLSWKGGSDNLIHDAFEKALAAHFKDKPRLVGMWAVCLHPYHEREHPLMMKVKDYTKGAAA